MSKRHLRTGQGLYPRPVFLARPARWLFLAFLLLACLSVPGAGCRSDAGPGGTVPAPPQGSDLPTVDIVRRLTPSVVHVFTESVATGAFNQLMPSTGVGTGIILRADGYVLTNNHVISGADFITITLNNGESYPGTLVGGDTNPDIAIVKIEASDLQAARTGSAADLQVGEDVIAIGHALALAGGPTVSKGVISALGRSIDAGLQETFVDLIQTDASINIGNSGGPLVNRRGEVIGVNTAAIQGGQGIGFAVNIDDAMAVSLQLIDKGFVERGFLGISPVNLTPAVAAQIGIPVYEGVVIARVVQESGAEAAGVADRGRNRVLGRRPHPQHGRPLQVSAREPSGGTDIRRLLSRWKATAGRGEAGRASRAVAPVPISPSHLSAAMGRRPLQGKGRNVSESHSRTLAAPAFLPPPPPYQSPKAGIQRPFQVTRRKNNLGFRPHGG